MKVVCYGASGHGRVVVDVLQCAGHTVLGFIDDRAEITGSEFAGLRILGTADALKRLDRKEVAVLVGIGVNRTRLAVAQHVRELGFSFATGVHPRAVLAADVNVGAGTIIMAGAIINPATIVGEHVIINTGATVDHDSQIGDGAHISPGVNLAGSVNVGRGVHVGIGACVIPGRTIGEFAIIGAGAVVIRDVTANVTVIGNPGKPL
jgi:sugar O-acyltransferase (sialic acid O-acetyltransferase NeuD family)